MKPYVVQSFKNDFGEVESVRLVADAKSSGLPVTTITMPNNITNGEELKSTVDAILDLVPGSLLIISKPKDQWVDAQFVFGLVGLDGSLTYGFRYRSNNIAAITMSSTYDFNASAGDEYYLISIPAM